MISRQGAIFKIENYFENVICHITILNIVAIQKLDSYVDYRTLLCSIELVHWANCWQHATRVGRQFSFFYNISLLILKLIEIFYAPPFIIFFKL